MPLNQHLKLVQTTQLAESQRRISLSSNMPLVIL
ncbi:MAG: hypothetical protein ACI9T7_001278 [Oleiphilaceae bacterium]|jgi:hypothetical protein